MPLLMNINTNSYDFAYKYKDIKKKFYNFARNFPLFIRGDNKIGESIQVS